MTTLQDISRDAGVSIKTVSRALRGEGYVATSTLARIQKSAKRLGYRPNRAARGLKTGRLQEVALVMWSIDAMGEAAELYMSKIRAFDHELRKAGLPLTIRIEGEGLQRSQFPEKLIAEIEEDRPLGVALLATDVRILAWAVKRLEEAGIETVVIDSIETGDFDNIYADRGAGITEAIRYLYAMGRRRIVYVGPDNATNRLEGYQRGIAEVGLKPCYHYLSHAAKSEFLFDQGRDAAKNLINMETAPDAAITYCDPIALGMLDALKERGLSLPRDFSVVGFDDKNAALLTTPKLTTIAHPNEEVGVAAAKMLMDKIKGTKPSTKRRAVSIPAQLVIRDSA